MDKAIKKRLSLLEMGLKRDTCFCLVQLPDGSEAEKTIEDWYQHSSEWRFLKMTRGGNNSAVLLVLAAIGNECAETAELSGDSEAAARLTAEAEGYLSEYKRANR